jgi:hypothetical protein
MAVHRVSLHSLVSLQPAAASASKMMNKGFMFFFIQSYLKKWGSNTGKILPSLERFFETNRNGFCANFARFIII